MEECYAIWYHLYNLKNVKNTHAGLLLVVKLQGEGCNSAKCNTLLWVFFSFLDCRNGTKSRKASQINKMSTFKQTHLNLFNILKVQLYRFETLPICSCSYKNTTLKISFPQSYEFSSFLPEKFAKCLFTNIGKQ